MNRTQAKELLPIIQAFAEGKEIQQLTVHGNWRTFESYTFTGGAEYRIKPGPEVIYVSKVKNGEHVIVEYGASINLAMYEYTNKKFIEVIE